MKTENDILSERADTYKHCEEQIQKKFGLNYQILHRRTIRMGGFLGIGEKEGIELEYIPTTNPRRSSYIPQEHVQRTQNQSFEESKEKIIQNAPAQLQPNPQILQMIKEMESIKELLKNAQLGSKNDEHSTILKIEHLLEENEFTSSYIRKITDKIRKNFSVEDLDDFEKVEEKVVEWIGKSIKIDDSPFRLNRPKIVVLVGPTGVGKTTTVAKLAANYVMPSSLNNQERLRVHAVTLDNYRIQAKEQLETICGYMEVPLSVAENVEDLQQIIAMYKNQTDVFVIDTIGYSPDAYENIGNMKDTLKLNSCNMETYLTMSATTKSSDMRCIMQQFEIFDFKSVILTKIDETNKVGNVISVLSEKDKPHCFITNGQTIPSDLKPASIVGLLIRLEGFNINRDRIEKLFPPTIEKI